MRAYYNYFFLCINPVYRRESYGRFLSALLLICIFCLCFGIKAQAYSSSQDREAIISNTLDFFEHGMGQKEEIEVRARAPQHARTARSLFYGEDPDTDYYKQVNKDYRSDYTQYIDPDPMPEEGGGLDFRLQILTGFRRDDFDWNIAGTSAGTSPNILSELTWKDLKMTQIKTTGQVTWDDHFVLDGMAAYADIYDGENQDSDYLGDNRTLEFSRSKSASDDGEAFDISGGLGYKFALNADNELFEVDDIWMTLLGGYSYHELTITDTELFQTIPALGPFAGLHSNYWAEWQGPWLGFELWGARKKLSGLFRFEYHFADYYGSANWNLRDDFQHPKSFEHEADGRGLVFKFGVHYQCTPSWRLDFNADLQEWEADHGVDRTFFSDGEVIETRLNEVNWDSHAVMFGATYEF